MEDSAGEYEEGIFQTAHEPLVIIDDAGRLIRASHAFARQFRIPFDGVAGSHLSDLSGGRWSLPELDALIDEAVRRRPEVCFAGFQADLGFGMRTLVVHARSSPGPVGGSESHVLLAIKDITDQRTVEGHYSHLSSVVHSSADSIFSWSLDGTVTTWNAGASRLFGYSADDMIGERIERIVPADRPAEIDDLRRRIRAGEQLNSFKTVRRRKDGSLVDVLLSLAPIRDIDGTVIGASVVGRDFSARLEEQAGQAQKMEAVGRLAGGIAHDFNNLLTAILGYADLVGDRLPSGSPLAEDIDQIKKAGLSASSLTRQLLAFSRRQMLNPKIICINDVVASIEPRVRQIIGERVELVTRLNPDLGNVNADPAQIEQVIVNLATNAREAMPEGGSLTIETDNVAIDEAFAESHIGTRAGPHVMVRLVDTGIGMDETVRKQAFEPFFSTKEKAKGTGLGLATVYGIVQQSGGTIWVESKSGQGAAFAAYLPAVDTPATRPSEVPEVLVETGTERILVVEDQDEVRLVVSAILRRGGYRVVEAPLPHEALATLHDPHNHFDLMLTDVVMPEMSGRQLATLVAELRPGLKVLYMSGYAEDAIVEDGVIGAGLAFIAKPFTSKALLRAVRATLDYQ